MTIITDTARSFFTAYPKQTFQKGEILIQAGDQLEHVFYLLEGYVNQYDITLNGNIVIVNVFRPGAFFPMASAINHTANHYFYEAASPVVVHKAPPEETVDFLKTHPDVTFNLLARVYKGVDGVLRRMTYLMASDAKGRLRFELLNAASRYGEHRADGTIFVPITESDIGHYSGLARETVSRQLQFLKRRGIIRMVRNGVVIESLQQLQDEADTF
ncbi:MAG TPA: Crp/Fnr family transcriptional regulator [Candidatus Saccharimonadales bacterium]|nr:Crp/Fnr family transcriptional regulator [Candidatus Saccharimonadales bacterium]